MTEANTCPIVRVEDVHKYTGEKVRLQGWLFNRRGSSKVQFIHIRDGSGFIQGVMGKDDVDEETFALARSLSQETAFIMTGVVSKEERALTAAMKSMRINRKLFLEATITPLKKHRLRCVFNGPPSPMASLAQTKPYSSGQSHLG